MNNILAKIFRYAIPILLLSIICSFIAITRIVEHRTNIALQDYSMLPDEQKVTDKVILGRSYPGFRYLKSKDMDYGIYQLFRSGAIELVCTDRGNILLVMKDFKHKYVGVGESDKAFLFIDFRVENGIKKGEVEINKVIFLSKDYFDTIASSPLSKLEINSIVKALEERTFDRIGFSTLEGGNSFYGNTKVSEVKKFINQCQQITNN